MNENADRELLERITKMLKARSGAPVKPLVEDSTQFDAVVRELQSVDSGDIENKLDIAGFVDHPVDELRCLECMYYKTHRKWCVLPEIDLPAEPDWWCRLWRI